MKEQHKNLATVRLIEKLSRKFKSYEKLLNKIFSYELKRIHIGFRFKYCSRLYGRKLNIHVFFTKINNVLTSHKFFSQ